MKLSVLKDLLLHSILLCQWFQAYPEFQKNPFFIAGESYAGIYVPTLSRNVAHGMFCPHQNSLHVASIRSLTCCMIFDIVRHVSYRSPLCQKTFMDDS